MKLLCLSILLSLIACKKDQPNIELVQNMMESPAYKAQDYNPDAKDGKSMRLPPSHTQSMNYPSYRYSGKPDEAEMYLRNPIAGDIDSLVKGKDRYETFCSVCHGLTGKGDGTVAPKMLLTPPPVISDKIIAWSDQAIFHIITDGRGMMGAYASQILPEERWAIVNYVRELQKVSRK